MAGLAISGGVYIVPAFAAVQAWSDADRRARVIAATNVLSAAFMVGGALTVAGLQQAGVPLPFLIALIGFASIAAGALIWLKSPTRSLADFLSILFLSIYRVEVEGIENIAKAGPNAIIALNHVSFLDAALAVSLLEKAPTFATDHGIAQKWWVKPFLGLLRALPLDPSRPMATRTLINTVRSGETLVIPEGRLTVTGSLMKVYDGVGLIADKSEAMVVPVKIDGLEKTFFTRPSRNQVRHRWWPKVKVTILEPVRLSVPSDIAGKERRRQAGLQLYQIMSDLVFRTADIDRTVFQAVAEAAKEHGKSRIALQDPLSGTMSYRKLLIGANLIGRKLMALTQTSDAVAVLLLGANTTGATILGLMSAGREPAMLNFTAGIANLEAACLAADIKVIVTSRSFIDKARMEPLVEALQIKRKIVYLEDISQEFSILDKIRAFLRADRPLVARTAEDPAAILFTSGSEGAPKVRSCHIATSWPMRLRPPP